MLTQADVIRNTMAHQATIRARAQARKVGASCACPIIIDWSTAMRYDELMKHAFAVWPYYELANPGRTANEARG